MMRFVVLALAVLLAGCQARFLRDEPPAQLDHVKTVFQLYADQGKQAGHKFLTHLDDTEFKDYKEFLAQSIDNIHGHLQKAFVAFKDFGEHPVVGQIMQSTGSRLEKVRTDIEDLRKQLEPKREELREVLEKHFQEYREEVKPFLEEYLDKQQKHMEEVRAKLEPLAKSLKEKITTNWEETKSKLVPILELVREKLTAHLQEVKTQLEPYMQEYKDQMEQGAQEFRKAVSSGELRKKMDELGAEVKPHFTAIFDALQKAFSK